MTVLSAPEASTGVEVRGEGNADGEVLVKRDGVPEAASMTDRNRSGTACSQNHYCLDTRYLILAMIFSNILTFCHKSGSDRKTQPQCWLAQQNLKENKKTRNPKEEEEKS